MRPQETAASYDKLAPHWAGDAFDLKNGIAQHERAIRFTSGQGPALDVGCGSSGRIIQLLIDRGFQAEGLDISYEMIALAAKKHPDLDFHQADICSWESSRSYEFISAWDSIWHVPLESQRSVLKKLCDALNPRGVLIFTSGGVDQADEVTNPCLGQPLYHAALGIPDLLRILAENRCVCRHLEYDQYPENHIYIIAQKA
jgi:SAM-dependent methyltransferase